MPVEKKRKEEQSEEQAQGEFDSYGDEETGELNEESKEDSSEDELNSAVVNIPLDDMHYDAHPPPPSHNKNFKGNLLSSARQLDLKYPGGQKINSQPMHYSMMYHLAYVMSR